MEALILLKSECGIRLQYWLSPFAYFWEYCCKVSAFAACKVFKKQKNIVSGLLLLPFFYKITIFISSRKVDYK